MKRDLFLLLQTNVDLRTLRMLKRYLLPIISSNKEGEGDIVNIPLMVL